MSSNQKIQISKVEFYITNVCNLNCSRYNRFNDHAFKGWQKWSDYAHAYAKWSEKIEIDQIVILGGKPATRKAFGEIKVTETKYNGRGNNNLIILWA